jgi:hypothetical protein
MAVASCAENIFGEHASFDNFIVVIMVIMVIKVTLARIQHHEKRSALMRVEQFR